MVDLIFTKGIFKAKGLVIDLRECSDGNSRFALQFASHFIREKLLAERMVHATYDPFSGNSTFGKSMEIDSVLISPDKIWRYTGPIVILQSSRTFGGAEEFALALHEEKRAVIVGEPSAGSTGNTVDEVLPGGAILSVCAMRIEYPDGRQFTGAGIEPDVKILPTRQDVFNHHDLVLKKGVELILSGRNK